MLVSEIERRSGLSRDTIRYYEQIGLLPPVPRSGNGYRNYSALTLEQLKFIRAAQQIGFSLDHLRAALPHLSAPGKPCAEVMAALQAQRAVILARIAEEKTRLAMLDKLAARLAAM